MAAVGRGGASSITRSAGRVAAVERQGELGGRCDCSSGDARVASFGECERSSRRGARRSDSACSCSAAEEDDFRRGGPNDSDSREEPTTIHCRATLTQRAVKSCGHSLRQRASRAAVLPLKSHHRRGRHQHRLPSPSAYYADGEGNFLPDDGDDNRRDQYLKRYFAAITSQSFASSSAGRSIGRRSLCCSS